MQSRPMNPVGYLIDITVCLRRLSLIPLPADEAEDDRSLAGSCWALPVVGAFLGGIVAIVYLLVSALGLGPGLAAVVAAAVSVGLTGAWPERALAAAATRLTQSGADGAPAFGEWGTISLVLVLAVRIGVVAAIGDPHAVSGTLVGAGAIGYGALLASVHAAPDDSPAGLAADLGFPPVGSIGMAVAIGAVISLIVVPHGWVFAIVLAAAATVGIIWRAMRSEPGTTGLIALTALPIAETLALLAIAAGR
jgi:adenosylcobinamide-GDP ribazoletransferase